MGGFGFVNGFGFTLPLLLSSGKKLEIYVALKSLVKFLANFYFTKK